MGNVLLTPDAEESRIDVWLYLAERSQSRDVADRFLDTVDQKCRLLAEHPELGEVRADLTSQVRQFPAGDYLILYKPLPDGILVLLVVHGSRDVPAVWRRTRFDPDG